MTRTLLHILFWLAYLSLNTLLVFFWDLPQLDYLPDGARLLVALKLSFGPLLPKMLFTYLVMYVILDRLVERKKKLLPIISLWVVSAILTILLIRFVQTSFVYNLAFEKEISAPPYLNTFSFLFGLVDIGFVSGAAIAIRQIRQRQASKEREAELLRTTLEAELKYLKNQINPHFLFNTLNNIYALARKKSDDTADVVMKLSKILRFMLYESSKISITLQQEIKLMEDYIDLERIRHRQKVNISFTTDLDDPSQAISPFLLLPFLENAFKHGVSESYLDASIALQVTLKAGELVFEIKNTKEAGQGQPDSSRIGLYNSRRQLEIIYPDHVLEVTNLPETFNVRLMINLEQHEKA